MKNISKYQQAILNVLMLLKKDLKDNLLVATSGYLDFLKLSTKMYLVPSIIVYPTSICNYNCDFCVSSSQSKSKAVAKEHMDFSVMQKLVHESASFLIKPQLHFSGLGEPLVYPNIRQTMQLCNERKLKWSMTTNGYVLDRYAEDLVTNNCKGINVSIHGDEKGQDIISQVPGSLKKTIAGINKLNEIKKQYNSLHPAISLNCAFNNHNLSRLEHILTTSSELPIQYMTFQHLVFTESDVENTREFLIDKPTEVNKIIKFIDFIKVKQEKKELPFDVKIFPKIHYSDFIGYYTDINYPFKRSCVLPWLCIRIYPNGDVKNCNVIFGNLKTGTLKSIINNKKAKKFRQAIRQGKFYTSECFRCCYRDFLHKDG